MRYALIIFAGLLLTACAQYSLVAPGPVALGGLTVEPQQAWNKAAAKSGGREVWTQDGLLLNSLVFFNGVTTGGRLFHAGQDSNYGRFDATMLPSEIMELTESSLAKLINSSKTTTADLKPATFAGRPGFQFTYAYVDASDVPMKGLATGAVADGKLYMILYQAAATHYYQKGLAEAERIIQTARLD